MEKHTSSSSFAVQVFDGENRSIKPIPVVHESIIVITVNGDRLVEIACTGLYLDELAAGFLRSEGIVKTANDIKSIVMDDRRNSIDILMDESLFSARRHSEKKMIAAGGARIGSPDSRECGEKIDRGKKVKVAPRKVLELMETMLSMARLHEETRGTHSSALATADEIICIREDIGRHNTIDMLGGYALLHDLSLSDKLLITTGRISSEMALKAWTIGVPIVVSHSAPTSRALDVLNLAGLTLIGYVRGNKMNIYTHSERVIS